MATRPAATVAIPPGGTRAETVLTEVGPVALEVPRDRDSSFDPKIARKRQRRLVGVEDLVISLVAKGLTTGEVQAHLAEIYGTEVSRQTISVITDRVLVEPVTHRVRVDAKLAGDAGAWPSSGRGPVGQVVLKRGEAQVGRLGGEVLIGTATARVGGGHLAG
jgi:hypothetical protein